MFCKTLFNQGVAPMYKIFCPTKNEIAVIPDEKNVLINIWHQDDGMLVSVETPISTVEGLLKDSNESALSIYEKLEKGEVLKVDGIYVSSTVDVEEGEEDEELEEGEKETDEDW